MIPTATTFDFFLSRVFLMQGAQEVASTVEGDMTRQTHIAARLLAYTLVSITFSYMD